MGDLYVLVALLAAVVSPHIPLWVLAGVVRSTCEQVCELACVCGQKVAPTTGALRWGSRWREGRSSRCPPASSALDHYKGSNGIERIQQNRKISGIRYHVMHPTQVY